MIIGLIVFGGLIVYIFLICLMMSVAIRLANKHGKKGWKAGITVTITMLLLMFWEWIPVQMSHNYYCSNSSGYFQYVSLEKFILNYSDMDSDSLLNNDRNWVFTESGRYLKLNNLVTWNVSTSKVFMGIRKRDERIIDNKNGKILAQYIDYDSGQNTLNPKKFRDFKIWLWTGSCEEGPKSYEKIKFNDYKNAIKYFK